MKKINEQNKKLDQIGRNLFKATKLSDADVEEIVSSPQLFDSVLAEIDSMEEQKSKSHWLDLDWLKVSFVNYKAAIGAFAVLFFFMIFVGLALTGGQESEQIAGKRVETKTSKSVNSSTSREIKNNTPKEFINNEKLIAKNNVADKKRAFSGKKKKLQRNIKKVSSSKPHKITKKQKKLRKPKTNNRKLKKKKEEKVFYTLPFNENRAIDSENLQIVNAKLSRAELFALGVSLQLENAVSTIKTELLVNEDGVARAIRVVEKF